MIDRNPVSSSMIASIGYRIDDQLLEIEFNTGAVYDYNGVPEYVHRNFLNAPSHGQYFHQNIKDIYPCYRIQ